MVRARSFSSHGRPTAGGRPARHSCLGLKVALLTSDEILDAYRHAIATNDRLLVGSLNLHTLYLARREVAVRDFHRLADLVYVDGMPVIWWLKVLRRPARRAHRATLVDWLPHLFTLARDHGWRVYYLGSRPGVAEKMAERFQANLPGLVIRTHHGYFDTRPDSAENDTVVEDINRFGPHVLLVGMGSPREQQWLLENHARLDAQIMQYCGATADLVAGVLPVPPRWLGRLGLEWLCRLSTRPRAVWRRYLLEPWCLLGPAAKDLWRAYGPRRS